METLLVYLANVGLTFAMSMSVLAPIFIFGFLFRKRITYFWHIFSFVTVAMILFAFLSPSNIPKNETFDRSTTQRQISQIEFGRKTDLPEIQDISRGPDLDAEARSDRFNDLVDFRARQQNK